MEKFNVEKIKGKISTMRDIWGANKISSKNEQLFTRTCSFVLAISCLGIGFGLGSLSSNKGKEDSSRTGNAPIVTDDELVNSYLASYIKKRDELETDIASLQIRKEELQDVQTFEVDQLVVMEHTSQKNESNLYILYNSSSNYWYEYHGYFEACYRMHPKSQKHYDFCGGLVHFDDCVPLYDCLTDDEKMGLLGNELTTIELDKILDRIRAEYKKEKSGKSKTLK